MSHRRAVEVFTAACPICEEAIQLVTRVACPSCDVDVLDVNDPSVAERARNLGIRSVPAVVIEGRLAACCKSSGPDEATLRALGLGGPG